MLRNTARTQQPALLAVVVIPDIVGMQFLKRNGRSSFRIALDTKDIVHRFRLYGYVIHRHSSQNRDAKGPLAD